MALEVKLPDLGEGIESGDVLDVLVSKGDTVAVDQPILELETDKATVEVPCSHAGKVTEIHVASGETVSIGSVILTLEAESAAAADPAPHPDPPAAASSPEPPTAPTPPTTAAPTTPEPTPATPAAAVPATPPPVASVPTPSRATSTPTADSDSDASAAAASPSIRRLAREVGVDIRTVQGSGPDSRITRDDIMSVVRNGKQPSQETEAAPVQSVAATVEVSKPNMPVVDEQTDSDDWGPVRVEPMTKIRKTIAAKMHESWSTVPRVTNFDDADVTELEEIRQASKSDYAARGIKLTQMPFLIKAVAMSLKSNPEVNAAIDEDNQQIIYKEYVNVGIAVDTDRGLLVPSLRGPDQSSIPEIARALGAMAQNARESNFKLEDLRGSTFTISNLGAIGGTYSTPIVNVPEVAILLVGRSRKMPVVVDDEVRVRLMMPMSLSYDHRLVDGATAARFLNDVIAYLESPSRLLIAP